MIALVNVTLIPLPEVQTPCPYLPGISAQTERAIAVEFSESGINYLLKQGFRHFGRFLFRPRCLWCGKCVPVRIDASAYCFSRSDRRVLRKTERAGFEVSLESHPLPDPALFELYLRHKKRFPFPAEDEQESYDSFVDSFFAATPGAALLRIRDKERTVAVSHIDLVGDTCSAVYCYWDEDYAVYSPGRVAILHEVLLAKSRGMRYLCLGYLIEENRSMIYKKGYSPLQVSTRPGVWFNWLDTEGHRIAGAPEHPLFIVEDSLRESLLL